MLSVESTLADLSTPFPVVLNTHAATVGEESIRWAGRYEMVDEPGLDWLRRAQFGRLVGLTNPFAGLENLQVASDWYMWLYAFDDGVCDESTLGEDTVEMAKMALSLCRALDDLDTVAGGGYAAALQDVGRRLRNISSVTAFLRWSESVHDYLAGQVWESAYRSSDQFPTIDEYIRMRESTGACHTVFHLFDMLHDLNIPAEALAAPKIRALTVAANRIVAWDNDLLSYTKELGDHGAIANLVAVIAHQNKTPLQAAVARAAEMRNAQLAKFQRVQDTLAGELATSAVNGYVSGLRHWISGSLEFHKTSPRFTASPRYARVQRPGDDDG